MTRVLHHLVRDANMESCRHKARKMRPTRKRTESDHRRINVEHEPVTDANCVLSLTRSRAPTQKGRPRQRVEQTVKNEKQKYVRCFSPNGRRPLVERKVKTKNGGERSSSAPRLLHIQPLWVERVIVAVSPDQAIGGGRPRAKRVCAAQTTLL